MPRNTDKRLDWHPYDEQLWANQKMPKEYKPVLLLCQNKDSRQGEALVVGYKKFGAGDKKSPYFVTPGTMGMRGKIIAWCDSFPEIEVFDMWEAARQAGKNPPFPQRDAAIKAEKRGKDE